jgi:cellulose synthase operon protein C
MKIHASILCVISGWLLLAFGSSAFAADGDKTPATQSSDAARRQFDGAVALHKGGAFDLAVDEWEKFLQKFPDDPLAAQAQFFAGVCYLSLKDKQFDKAREAFEKVVARYPKFDQIDKAYFNLGLADYNLAQAGRADLRPKAAEAFGQLIDKFPKSPQVPEALLYRGESLYAAGNKAEALKAWNELASKHVGSPARSRGLYNLGIAQQELGRQADAGTTFDAFLKDFSGHELAAEVKMRKGDTLLETGRFAEAERRFADALAQRDFPLADYATLRLGAALAGEKKYAEAAAAYDALPARFPKSNYVGAATLAAGNCYYLAGNQPEARNWLGKVLAGGGDQAAEAAHWIARSWLKEKHPAEALAAVEKALPLAEKSPRRGDLLMDQADALYDLPGRRGEAAALYAKLAEKGGNNPQSAQALYMAASASLGAGDYPAALKHVEAFNKTFPNNALAAEVQFIAAEAQLLSGNHADADKRYQELLDKFPNHADAEQWLVRRALARYLQRKYSDVVSYLQPQVAKLRTTERKAEAEFLLGSSELELTHFREAVQALKASLAAQPKGPQTDETLFALAIAQRGASDPNGARDTIARLLAEFGNSKVAERAHFRSAEWKFEAGDYVGAAADYDWVLNNAGSTPLVPGALVGLGWSQINRSEYSKAARTFSTVLEKYYGTPAAARARYGRAAARQQLKEFAGAIEDAEAFLKADPKSAERSDALYVLGLAQEGAQKFGDAAKSFQALLEADPKYSAADKALYELAWSRKSSNQEEGAAEAFAKLAGEHGDSPLAPESWFNVGEYRYHQKKDFKGAAEAYYAAVTKAGKGELAEKAVHKLGWAYFQAQDYSDAQKAFESEFGNYPNGPLAADAAFMIGESLFKQEQYTAALAALQKAIGMKPSSAEFGALALLHAGQAAGQTKRWDESLKLLARLAKEYPDSLHVIEATYEQAWAKQNLNQLDEALKLYEAVTDKSDAPIGARARFMMGEVLFTQGNHKEAVRNFFKVLYGYGDTQAAAPYKTWQANAAYEAARCFEVLKSAEQAKKLYNELLTKYPDSDKAAAAKDRLKQLGG